MGDSGLSPAIKVTRGFESIALEIVNRSITSQATAIVTRFSITFFPISLKSGGFGNQDKRLLWLIHNDDEIFHLNARYSDVIIKNIRLPQRFCSNLNSLGFH